MVPCPRCHQRNAPESFYCFACGMPFDVAGSAPSHESGASARWAPSAFTLDRPGGFWIRLLAYLIDLLVIVFPFAIALILLDLPTPATWEEILARAPEYQPLQLLTMLATLIYDTLLISLFATTVGKRAFRLYVVRSDGSRIGPGRALSRHLLTVLSFNFTFGLVFLMVAFRQDKRGLHDLICDTVVVWRGYQPEQPPLQRH